MQEIKKALYLTKLPYYITHLSIFNCLIPNEIRMTPKEIEVLANFMALGGEKYTYRFGPSGNKAVMAACNLSPSGLSNYYKTLLSKGMLKKVGDIISVPDIIEPEKDKQIYLLKIELKN